MKRVGTEVVQYVPRRRLEVPTSSSRRYYVRKATPYSRYKSKRLYRLGGRMPADSGELKDITNLFTTANQFALATSTATLLLCNGCAQGTTANTRLGRRIVMRSILIRGVVSKSTTQTGEGGIRVLLVYDMQANATAPLATDILQSDSIQGVQNLNNSNRFKIIYDKHFALGAVDNTVLNFKKYIKCAYPTQFNSGSAGTIGDIQTGSLYLMTYGPQIGTALPNGGTSVRVRFSDN